MATSPARRPRPSSASQATREDARGAALALIPSTPVRATTPLQRGLVSAFVVFHLLAIAWWNLTMINYRPPEQARPDDFWSRFGAFAEGSPATRATGKVFRSYIRGSALWQQWVLFGPDAPHVTYRTEVLGITGFDAQGRPIFDEELLYNSDDPTITERTQLIGNPPCGFELGADPKSTFLRASFAQYHAREVGKERGVDYLGVQLRCLQRPIHRPGEDPEDHDWTVLVLWAGPVGEPQEGP